MIPAENSIQKKLLKVINESLELLKQASIKEQKPVVLDIPIPSLLDQCIELCDEHHAQTQEPLRTVHHFGLPVGSPLLSSLATLANTCVLTDIHPANNSFKDSIKSQTLVAKSIKYDYNNEVFSTTEDDEYRIKVFLNDLQQSQKQSNQIGQRLLICDNHCLSQTGKTQSSDLLSLLKRKFTLRSLIVVTDPIDSYPVYCAQMQTDTPPLAFEEYCQSILDFIQGNPDLTVIRHEDFVAGPEKVMREICQVLRLPVCEDFLLLGEVFAEGSKSKALIQHGKDSIELKKQTKGISYQKLGDLLKYSVVCVLDENKEKIHYQPLINESLFIKKQTIRLSDKISQTLSENIEWVTLPVQAGFEYYLKGTVDSGSVSDKHVVALCEFIDAYDDLIEDESVPLVHSEIGYYQYIKINKTGQSDFFLSFLVPDLCFFLRIGFRSWGNHKDEIDIKSVIETEINTSKWSVAYDTCEYKDAVTAYVNAYKYIDKGDFIKAVHSFKIAERIAPQLKFPYAMLRKENIINEENISFLNSNNEFENTWAISEHLFITILDILPVGSTILELGSGTGTKELCKYYKVISIEHNPEWLNKSEAEYIYAPLIDDYWYDPTIIAKELENKNYDLLLIDGPPQFRRGGVLEKFDLFKQSVPIIFDDISRNEDAYAMNRLAEKLNKRPETHIMGTKGFALIR